MVDGVERDALASDDGVQRVRAGDFPGALRRLLAPWWGEHADAPIIAAGMVGSQQGWREVAYLDCPAYLEQLGAALTYVEFENTHVALVPGLTYLDAAGIPDVMRGEEVQVLGAKRLGTNAELMVLPGTHCKWASVSAESVIGFRTFMTGEVFAALSAHTILGRTIDSSAPFDADAFRDGVGVGMAPANASGDLLSRVFSARTLTLFERLTPAAGRSYLSGLLIGAEVASACAEYRPADVVILGEDTLAQYYAQALEVAGIVASPETRNVSAVGMHAIASIAGLSA